MVSYHILNEYMRFHGENMSQNDVKITKNSHVGTWWSLGDQDGSLLVPRHQEGSAGGCQRWHAGKPGFFPGPTGLQPGPTGLQPGFPGEFLALKPTTYGSKQKETLTRSTPRGVGGLIDWSIESESIGSI